MDAANPDPEPVNLLALATRRRDGGQRGELDPVANAAPAPVFRDPSHVLATGVVVGVNSCPDCAGLGTCRECDGVGKVVTPIQGVPNFMGRCPRCQGQRACLRCHDHRANLWAFAMEMENGSPGSAEACLQRAMVGNVQDDRKAKSTASIGAAGIGAILGTIVAPGLGTIVGLSLGKMLGDAVEPDEGWKQADLLFSLGVLYASTGRKAEASQAWIKALTLNEHHDEARAALKEAL